MDKKINSINELSRECNVFCYYLINQKPNKYVMGKYHDAHSVGSIKQSEISPFDKLLISIALINLFLTRLVDVYTSIFLKNAVIRKKLILLLAILESCEPSCYYFDTVTHSGKSLLFIKVFQKVLVFMFSLGLSLIIFMPLYVISKILLR